VTAPDRARWWLWLAPLIAAAAWWPIGSYWASDDFLALHYANDLSRAASDLVGPQYGATDIWLFYRPFITLSFWFDQLLGGTAPFVSHLSNVAAHMASALLMTLVWRRFVDDRTAATAGVLWALMPSHVGSIAWAVGRVDSHTVVWCVLAAWLCLRGNERRARGEPGARWPCVLATAGALCSKELAFVLPPLLSWLSLLQLRDVRGAWRATWPVWLLFAAYLPFRLLVLGRFGGYSAAGSLDPMAALTGLPTVFADLTVPLGWIGAPPDGGAAPQWLWIASAAAPIGAALVLAALANPKRALAALLTFVLATVPMYAFLAQTQNPHNLRYYYLPAMALCGLLATAGRWVALTVLLAWAWPFVAVRVAQHAADRECAAMHAAMLDVAEAERPDVMFVAGMPHANAAGTAVQLHYGVDRMLRAPFAERDVALYAWRPLANLPGIWRLTPPGAPPFALPIGTTWWFSEPGALLPVRADAEPTLPDLPLTGDVDGVLDLTTPRLTELLTTYEQIVADNAPSFGLQTPGVRPIAYRVTLFTANGYLSSVCGDHARQGRDGRIDMLRWLAGDPKHPIPALQPAAFLTNRGAPAISKALEIPTTIDLEPSFPALVEAGTIDLQDRSFTPTHRARRLVTFRFDRGYPAWVRRAEGKGD